VAPVLAGVLVDRTEAAAAALWLAAAFWLLTVPAFWTFRALQRRGCPAAGACMPQCPRRRNR
jgi:hypothetical protein